MCQELYLLSHLVFMTLALQDWTHIHSRPTLVCIPAKYLQLILLYRVQAGPDWRIEQRSEGRRSYHRAKLPCHCLSGKLLPNPIRIGFITLTAKSRTKESRRRIEKTASIMQKEDRRIYFKMLVIRELNLNFANKNQVLWFWGFPGPE